MKWLKKAGYVLCLLVFLFLTLGPFVWAFILSITPEHAMLAKSAALLPEVVTQKLSGTVWRKSERTAFVCRYRKFVKSGWHDFVGWDSNLSDECIHVESYGI